MLDRTEEFASKHLGKKSIGSEYYDPSLLVVVPRCENRKRYNIHNENLPFVGCDIWHGYEFSSLTENGIPFTRVLKLKYNCDNEYLIESKSLKLYLNSFNMTRFGKNIEEAIAICKSKIEKDLSEKLETIVEVNFLENVSNRVEIFSEFQNIMQFIDEESLVIEGFKESPEVLKALEGCEEVEYCLTFDSLRSNCRVTHQPDFGDVFIYYKSKKHIDEGSLVQYLTSFRSEYHFHEECCEMIFKRLQDILNEQDELFVSALYTRRGGLDISPVRLSKNCTKNFAEKLLDLSCYARNGIKQ